MVYVFDKNSPLFLSFRGPRERYGLLFTLACALRCAPMTFRCPDTGVLTRCGSYPEYALAKLLETSQPAPLASLAWIGGVRAPLLLMADNVTQFEDGDEFLLAPHAFEFDFFLFN